eukprot:6157630-Prorocentrum_lima.AAC.1
MVLLYINDPNSVMTTHRYMGDLAPLMMTIHPTRGSSRSRDDDPAGDAPTCGRSRSRDDGSDDNAPRRGKSRSRDDPQ